jgi:hypothetical protein
MRPRDHWVRMTVCRMHYANKGLSRGDGSVPAPRPGGLTGRRIAHVKKNRPRRTAPAHGIDLLMLMAHFLLGWPFKQELHAQMYLAVITRPLALGVGTSRRRDR